MPGFVNPTRSGSTCAGLVLFISLMPGSLWTVRGPLQGQDVRRRQGSFLVDFKYRELEVKLVRARWLDVRSFPPDPRSYFRKHGFWCELRNQGRAVVYRRALANPFAFDVEVHTLDRKFTPHRRIGREHEGNLSVIVPAVPGATLELFLSTPSIAARFRGPRRLISVELEETKKNEPPSDTQNDGGGQSARSTPRGGIEAVKIVDNGFPFMRLNLAIVSEGYTDGELAKFRTDAQDFVDHLFTTAPFDGPIGKALNVFRVDVPSNQSGADCPAACCGADESVDTYFDASFCADGATMRLLKVDADRARQTAFDATGVGIHETLVFVNSCRYGGLSYSTGVAVTSVHGTGWEDVALHELGHSWFALADEYPDYSGLCSSHPTFDDYSGWDRVERNVTTLTDRMELVFFKWGAMIAVSTPLPTLKNGDCSSCPAATSPFPTETVGLFEGAMYHHCGIYRPQLKCKMLSSSDPFCAGCARAIVEDLEGFAP